LRKTLISAASFFLAAGAAFAAPPKGYETIYDAPTRVNMGGRPVTADIALHTDKKAAAAGDLRLVLATDVTPFIADVEKDLEKWVATHQDRCGQRWGAGKPTIDFPPGAIRFALDIEVEVYGCGWNGEGEPSRIAREAASIDVLLDPYVEAGKLQARLASLTISNRAGLSKFLPLETLLRPILDDELKNLNGNPKFYKAPKPFISEGFGYESIIGRRNSQGRVLITARYRATGDKAALTRVVDRVRTEGITAEGVRE
jgi:hypothetical protein